MAVNDPEDIYNDPDTFGGAAKAADDDDDTTDDVDGQPDDDLPDDPADPSQSIYTPEKNTTKLDDRGPIVELEAADRHDTSDIDDDLDLSLLDDAPSSQDGDDFKPASEVSGDERDGNDPA